MKYIPDNLKEFESPANEIPDYLREIQQLLDTRWKLVVWQRYKVNDNWIAGVMFGNRHFRLMCDRGYVDVYEITTERERWLPPPQEQHTNISPKQICELLGKAVA